MKEVLVVFDIGKTNKKVLIFDLDLQLIFQKEQVFTEGFDENNFPCEAIENLENWIFGTLEELLMNDTYVVKAVNFTTYGATLVYLDALGQRLAPVYNYMKPIPSSIEHTFYELRGDKNDFMRVTASPALGMLNAGLQIYWFKSSYPKKFENLKYILHFPQYLSFLFTRQISSEHTSIGCHTALWDFDQERYHSWLMEESIHLPQPQSSHILYPAKFKEHQFKVATGLHDSSASLVPYLLESKAPFVLVSTGTWSIFMNPYNHTPLTINELEKDTLCYLSIEGKPVKSSRLFMGHIHDVNVSHLTAHFKVEPTYYKTVIPDILELQKLFGKKSNTVFFKQGIPEDYIDKDIILEQFENFNQAYHRFMFDLVQLALSQMELIISPANPPEILYITGGFARNELFVRILTTLCHIPQVYISEIDNATALGGALNLKKALIPNEDLSVDLGLERVVPFQIQTI